MSQKRTFLRVCPHIMAGKQLALDMVRRNYVTVTLYNVVKPAMQCHIPDRCCLLYSSHIILYLPLWTDHRTYIS